MKLQVFHEIWQVQSLKDESFNDLHGKEFEDKDAVVSTFEKRIDFRADSYKNIAVIRHELCHVILSYMILDDLNLDRDQNEEFLCEFLSKYGLYIEKLTKEIYNKL